MHQYEKIIYSGIGVILVGIFIYAISNQFGGTQVEVTPEVQEQVRERSQDINIEQDYIDRLNQNTLSGGVPKDGIPSIDEPKYETIKQADQWLEPNDIVMGVEKGDLLAAYPQRILVNHEVVNETIDGKKHSLTYCPLTGTAIGYQGTITEGVEAEFGVSGDLVNSNLIMYDRASDTHWSQILGQGITEPGTGIALEEFPVTWTTWERWKEAHPDTEVLSRDTGFTRSYDSARDPYGSYIKEDQGYYTSDAIMFEPVHEDDRFAPKKVFIGIRDQERNAVTIDKDRLRQEQEMQFMLGDEEVTITYDEELDFYRAEYSESGEWVNAFDTFWFPWVGFFPDTKVIS